MAGHISPKKRRLRFRHGWDGLPGSGHEKVAEEPMPRIRSRARRLIAIVIAKASTTLPLSLILPGREHPDDHEQKPLLRITRPQPLQTTKLAPASASYHHQAYPPSLLRRETNKDLSTPQSTPLDISKHQSSGQL
jgi:hypothetical protein